jgi:hypothetical protein
MAGELVPLVMIPRFTTLSGAGDFYTVGMDVTEYETATLNVWRGPDVGTTPTFQITCQESTDQTNWTTCAGSGATSNNTPGAEIQIEATLKKRWFRVKVTLGGSSPVLSCWAVGFLEERIR